MTCSTRRRNPNSTISSDWRRLFAPRLVAADRQWFKAKVGLEVRETPIDQPVDAFSHRIQALAKAHDALLKRSIVGALIRPTIEGVVELVADRNRVLLAGPDIEINARSVVSFSLLIHELATNATKYGSLSKPDGGVRVAWRIETGSREPQLALEWREEGGPPATPPQRRGFGSRLIQSGLAGTGQADIRYEPTGLHARFRAPLAFLITP